MRNSIVRAILAAAALLGAALPAQAVEKIVLYALFKDKAIVVVDGARRVLRRGDSSPEGITLVSTDTQAEQAEIELDGKRRVLALGIVAARASGTKNIILYPDQRRGGHYFADGLINGVSVRFMVDTGATTVAMSAATAQRIGLNYRNVGRPGVSHTAGGGVPVYIVNLADVQIGEAALQNVEGAVIESMQTHEVLLGMSVLGRFDMKRDSEKLELMLRP